MPAMDRRLRYRFRFSCLLAEGYGGKRGVCVCTCLLPQAASPPALKRAPLTCHSGHILKHILAILLLINGLKFVAVQYGRKVLSTGEGAGYGGGRRTGLPQHQLPVVYENVASISGHSSTSRPHN